MIARAPVRQPTYEKPTDAREALAAQTDKLVITWEPRYNSDISIELSGCIIFGVPEFLDSISVPKDQVMLALLGEIVELKNQIADINKRMTSGQLSATVQATKDQAVLNKSREDLESKTE